VKRRLDDWLGANKLLKVLSETARHEGQILFTELVGKKTRKWRHLPQVTPSFKQNMKEALEKAREELSKDGVFRFTQKQLTNRIEQTKKRLEELPKALKAEGDQWLVYYENLPTLSDKAEFVGFLILYIGGYVGGTYLGYQLPNQNIRIVLKSDESKSFTLHSAPLLTLELALEWCIAILDRTLEQPQILDPKEQRRLTEAKQILLNFLHGLSQGASAKLVTGRKLSPRRWNMTWRLPVELAAFEMVRNLFKNLVDEKNEETK
jgi:hypothetical protein